MVRHRHCSGPGYIGNRRTPTYRSWANMIQRCTNPKAQGYKYWGGRGITVCGCWQGEHGFESFLADMGEKPDKKYTIERIENDKGYSPDNCEWATRTKQNRNRRGNVFVFHKGEKIVLSEFIRRTGICHRSTYQRYAKKGLTHETIIQHLTRPRIKSFLVKHGIHRSYYDRYKRKGYTNEQIIDRHNHKHMKEVVVGHFEINANFS